MVMCLLLAYFYAAIGMSGVLIEMCRRGVGRTMKGTDIILFSATWPVTMGVLIFEAAKHIFRIKTKSGE